MNHPRHKAAWINVRSLFLHVHRVFDKWNVLKLHEMLQSSIERAFFGGRSTRSSVYLTYAIGNVILMLLLFYVLLNRIAYDWTGSLYPVGSGFRLDFLSGGLEDAIPFVPEMAVFYVYLFYPMVVLTMLYFAFVEYKKGYALGWSLVVINAIAVAVYAVFPVSVYWWHQEFLAHPIVGNFWAAQAYDVWAGDTTFNCFPSLHAAVSVICFYTWYQYYRMKRLAQTNMVAIVSFVITVGVMLSTLFLKQHYIADEIAGIALAYGVGRQMFKHFWKLKPAQPLR
jgi:membrane-associated phospholipid phosphatase